MDYYINKQAAIDALMVAIDDVGVLDGDDIKAVFDNLPSASLPQWIPCSERKPELWHKVIVTIRGTDFITCEDGESIEEAIERTQNIERVDVGFIGSDGWYGADGYPMIVRPIAWMPLPEAYEGE